MVPDGAASWLVVQPRAIYEHPRLGRLLARAFDDAGDQALFERARRVGYDVRTVERALLAWRGPTTFAAAFGALDTRRIDALLWERLLPPRERREHDGVTALRGVLGDTPTVLAVWNTCSLVLWAEGPGVAPMRTVDRAMRGGDARASVDDDDALVSWHGTSVPAPLVTRAPATLLEGVRDVVLRAGAAEGGVRVHLRLEGALPDDASVRMRRALDALIEEPLGDAIGALRWLRAEDVSLTTGAGSLDAEVLVPWAALDALADVLRGRVGDRP